MNDNELIETMTPEELLKFRNSFCCDDMGYEYSEEGVCNVKHTDETNSL